MDRCIKPRLLKLSKIEAAKHQIESAVWLWFVDANIVSVHTLTAAAHRLLVELAALWETPAWPCTSDYYLEHPEKKRRKRPQDPTSFFQEAKKNEHCEISQQWTELYLFDAIMAYSNLAEKRAGSILMSTFVLRFGVERQDLFVTDAFSLLERRVSETFNLKRLERLSKMDFLQEFLGYLGSA